MAESSGQTLSVVVPCYNEQETVNIFVDTTQPLLEELVRQGSLSGFEFIFVDDGSSDGTLAILQTLHGQNSHVHYLSFSRNFGKEAGIYAGLQRASGDYVALMDVDLQDPPDMLPDMLRALQQEGYDCAATRRSTRTHEPPLRSLFSRLFYKLINALSDVVIEDGARDFRVMSRAFVNAVLSIAEKNRFSKGIFAWVGFKTKFFAYENRERSAGNTKWNFWGLLGYAFDGIIAFSTKPLMLASVLGMLSIILAFLLIVFLIVRKLVFNNSVEGWASMLCIIIFIGGVQLLCTGIIGQYLAKNYIETKQRPLFIVREEG